MDARSLMIGGGRSVPHPAATIPIVSNATNAMGKLEYRHFETRSIKVPGFASTVHRTLGRWLRFRIAQAGPRDYVIGLKTGERMARVDAKASGMFRIGGNLRVNRLGFGAMRITGEGIWGDPKNPKEARRTLARVPELGIDLIDTADSYGPFVSEDLIGEVLGKNRKVVIATKGGLVRTGPGEWRSVGRPDYLRQCVLMSLRRLRRERIDLWQLHRIDSEVPAAEQFGVMADMQREGLIRHLGLSEVSVKEIQAASRHFKVATVQNLYNLGNRQSESVLDYCAEHGIGFIPWFPLNAGSLSKRGGVVTAVAKKLRATPSQVALAWLLQRSPVMLPIPGTGNVSHLVENTGAASLQLSAQDFQLLDSAGKPKPKRRTT
jgi:aryl-alcohol dehydrogenase-like predicted oxidoreductase